MLKPEEGKDSRRDLRTERSSSRPALETEIDKRERERETFDKYSYVLRESIAYNDYDEG